MSLLPFVLALAGPFLPAAQDDSTADGNKLVAVALLADRAEIQPGSTFTLGVRCRVERRWHVYWGENAGEAGLPISADISGPPGYEIGPLRHPWPERHELEGDIVEYTLDGEFWMLADVKVPVDAKVGSSAGFEVSSRWLVCTTVCVPGSGGAKLALPVAEKEKPAHDAEFKVARARLPLPWSEMTRTMSSWSGTESSPRLALIVPGATALEFFPYTSKTRLASRSIEVGKQGATLTLDLVHKGREPGDVPAARGVLWVKTDKGEAAYVLDQPWKKP